MGGDTESSTHAFDLSFKFDLSLNRIKPLLQLKPFVQTSVPKMLPRLSFLQRNHDVATSPKTSKNTLPLKRKFPLKRRKQKAWCIFRFPSSTSCVLVLTMPGRSKNTPANAKPIECTVYVSKYLEEDVYEVMFAEDGKGKLNRAHMKSNSKIAVGTIFFVSPSQLQKKKKGDVLVLNNFDLEDPIVESEEESRKRKKPIHLSPSKREKISESSSQIHSIDEALKLTVVNLRLLYIGKSDILSPKTNRMGPKRVIWSFVAESGEEVSMVLFQDQFDKASDLSSETIYVIEGATVNKSRWANGSGLGLKWDAKTKFVQDGGINDFSFSLPLYPGKYEPYHRYSIEGVVLAVKKFGYHARLKLGRPKTEVAVYVLSFNDGDVFSDLEVGDEVLVVNVRENKWEGCWNLVLDSQSLILKDHPYLKSLSGWWESATVENKLCFKFELLTHVKIEELEKLVGETIEKREKEEEKKNENQYYHLRNLILSKYSPEEECLTLFDEVSMAGYSLEVSPESNIFFDFSPKIIEQFVCKRFDLFVRVAVNNSGTFIEVEHLTFNPDKA